jgi:hypothetical protein
MAGVSVATGRRIERHPRPPSSRREGRDYRTRPDPLEGLWDEEIVSMLEAAPALRPITILRELARRHPETRQCLAEAPTGGVPALLSNNARRRKHRREARPSCRAADERPTAGRPRLNSASKKALRARGLPVSAAMLICRGCREMPYYEATRAEEMFCSEAHAGAAGYRRAIVRP